MNSTVNQTVAIVSNVFQVRFSTPATSVHVLQELTNPTDNVYLVLILTVSVAHLHKNVSSVLPATLNILMEIIASNALPTALTVLLLFLFVTGVPRDTLWTRMENAKVLALIRWYKTPTEMWSNARPDASDALEVQQTIPKIVSVFNLNKDMPSGEQLSSVLQAATPAMVSLP